MTIYARSVPLAAATLLTLGLAGAAQAQETATAAPPPPTETKAEEESSWLTVTGSVTFVSDYMFRGVSLSDNDPAIQGALNFTTAPGFFVSMWGSSIAPYGGANVEYDIYGGWSKALGPVTPTIGIYGYTYPGGSGVNYYEIYGSLGFALGPVGMLAGFNVAPNQKNTGDDGTNTYLYFQPSFGIPGAPITLKANVGYETGAIVRALGTGNDNKWDWLVGADIKWKMLTVGLAYVGNNRSDFGGILGDKFVFSVGGSF